MRGSRGWLGVAPMPSPARLTVRRVATMRMELAPALVRVRVAAKEPAVVRRTGSGCWTVRVRWWARARASLSWTRLMRSSWRRLKVAGVAGVDGDEGVEAGGGRRGGVGR